MANRRIPQATHHKATGQAVVRLDGKDHYLGKFGTEDARIRYEALIGKWLTNGRRLPAEPARDGEVSVNALVLAYVSWAEKRYVCRDRGESPEVHDLKRATRILRSLFGRLPVREFSPKKLREVRDQMAREGWSRNHVGKQLGRLKRMFRWGVAEELVPAAVHQGLLAISNVPKGTPGVRETEPVGPVALDLVEATLPLMPKPVEAMARLQLLTGMRPGEVVLMRGADIDTTGEVWIYTPEHHKTEHHGLSRIVYIGPKAQAVLRPWLRENPEEYLFSTTDAVERMNEERAARRKTKKTPSEIKKQAQRAARRKKKPRTRYGVQSYRQAIQRSCERAEVAIWSPNQLRHTYATQTRRKFGLDGVQVMLGHADADTSQIYAEADKEAALKIAREVG